MINNIQYTPITFSGKGFNRKLAREAKEYFRNSSPYAFERLYSEHYPIPNKNISLEKSIWGYKAPHSVELEKYTGTTIKNAGFSTEAGGYGGGWIKAAGDVPLSTKDVHTCAVLYLENKNTNEHMLYHVYGNGNKNLTPIESIKTLITKEFPRFTHVSILPGDQMQTNSIVNNINSAVDELNPKAFKTYYHMSSENPEIVAQNGKLTYLDNLFPNKMTFTEVKDQYNY